MGFGGINTHVVLDGRSGRRTAPPRPTHASGCCCVRRRTPSCSLFAAPTRGDARARRRPAARTIARSLSRAELGDPAGRARPLAPATAAVRAAVVASRRRRAQRAARRAGSTVLDAGDGRSSTRRPASSSGRRPARRGSASCFPGQGSPGARRRRRAAPPLPARRRAVRCAALPAGRRRSATEVAQPAIVTASLAGLRVLDALGIEADVAVGHSLGELTALHWAGAIDERRGQRIAAARGQAMAELAEAGGTMAGLALDPEAARAARRRAAGRHRRASTRPEQTVVSGPADAVDAVARARARARRRRHAAARLARLPLAAGARGAGARRAARARARSRPPRRRVVSTVTGDAATPADDLRALLRRQVTAPVRFAEALSTAAARARPAHRGRARAACSPASPRVGRPGARGRARRRRPVARRPAARPRLPRARSARRSGIEPLFDDRFTRPFDLDRPPQLVPRQPVRARAARALTPTSRQWRRLRRSLRRRRRRRPEPPRDRRRRSSRELVAERAELPARAVTADSRLLDDLHLNSITVGQIAVEAARGLGLPPPLAPQRARQRDGRASWPRRSPAGDAPGRRPARRAARRRARGCGRSRSVGSSGRRGTAPRRTADGGRWRVFAPRRPPARRGARREALAADRRRASRSACPSDVDDADRAADARRGAGRAVRRRACSCVQTAPGEAAGLARSAAPRGAGGAPSCVVDAPADERGAGWAAAEAMSPRVRVRRGRRYAADGGRLRAGAAPPPASADRDALPVGAPATCCSSPAAARASRPSARCARRGRRRRARAARPLRPRGGRRARGQPRAPDRALACAADVTERDVRSPRPSRRRRAALGPVTAVVHAAGAQRADARSPDLDATRSRRTLAPKVTRAARTCSPRSSGAVRLLVTFGSIIARTGLRGEAHYALANEWQTALTERFARDASRLPLPGVRVVGLVGVGMGERLGSVEALAREGVDAIAPDAGADLLARAAAHEADRPTRSSQPAASAGRRRSRSSATSCRCCASSSGRSCTTRASSWSSTRTCSPSVDPYLDDHVLDGERLLPAVIGLEAMAQAVAGAHRLGRTHRCFEDVGSAADRRARRASARRCASPRSPTTPARAASCCAASRTGVRRSTTSAHAGARAGRSSPTGPRRSGADGDVPLDPADLYGTLLFQAGRFRRLRRYRG